MSAAVTCQEWLGITHFGHPVLDENNEHHPLWISSKRFLYEGYECKRTISSGNNKYYFINQVYKSTCGKPLFRTLTYKDVACETLLSCFNCTSTYSCYKKTLARWDIKIKGKLNGNRFFGLELADYNKRPANHDAANIDQNLSHFLDPSHERTSSWESIISYGFPVLNDNRYVKKIGNINCRLQPGYKVARKLKISLEKTVKLYLTIEESARGPLFTAYTEEEPRVSLSTYVPNELKQVYPMLGMKCSKNWSGFEFFGFYQADVLCVVTCAYETASKHENSKMRKIELDNNLSNLKNIRHRNAGKTSTLCDKAAKNRNEKIKDIVEYATFGDLKSKLYNLFKICEVNTVNKVCLHKNKGNFHQLQTIYI